MALEDQVQAGVTAEMAESVISSELGALHNEIDRLDHQLGRLRTRAAPALGGPRPEVVPSEPGGEFFGSEIAKSVHQARLGIARMVETAAEIVERLET